MQAFKDVSNQNAASCTVRSTSYLGREEWRPCSWRGWCWSCSGIDLRPVDEYRAPPSSIPCRSAVRRWIASRRLFVVPRTSAGSSDDPTTLPVHQHLQSQGGEHFTGLAPIVSRSVGKCIYIAHFCSTSHPRRSCMHHSVTCNYTNACLYLVSVHQMAPPQTEVADI